MFVERGERHAAATSRDLEAVACVFIYREQDEATMRTDSTCRRCALAVLVLLVDEPERSLPAPLEVVLPAPLDVLPEPLRDVPLVDGSSRPVTSTS